METLETTFAGKSVTVTADPCPDGVCRVSIKTAETSIFGGPPRIIALGFATWADGAFDFFSAVCTAAQRETLASELRANGWN